MHVGQDADTRLFWFPVSIGINAAIDNPTKHTFLVISSLTGLRSGGGSFPSWLSQLSLHHCQLNHGGVDWMRLRGGGDHAMMRTHCNCRFPGILQWALILEQKFAASPGGWATHSTLLGVALGWPASDKPNLGLCVRLRVPKQPSA